MCWIRQLWKSWTCRRKRKRLVAFSWTGTAGACHRQYHCTARQHRGLCLGHCPNCWQQRRLVETSEAHCHLPLFASRSPCLTRSDLVKDGIVEIRQVPTHMIADGLTKPGLGATIDAQAQDAMTFATAMLNIMFNMMLPLPVEKITDKNDSLASKSVQLRMPKNDAERQLDRRKSQGHH